MSAVVAHKMSGFSSTHEWVPGQQWDLIVTMDDATNEHYSMFFVDEEGTQSSFRGVREVIEARGLAYLIDKCIPIWLAGKNVKLRLKTVDL